MNIGLPISFGNFSSFIIQNPMPNAGKRDKICTEEGENFIERRQVPHNKSLLHPLQEAGKGPLIVLVHGVAGMEEWEPAMAILKRKVQGNLGCPDMD